MALVNDPTDPANMTAEERVAEAAAILAEGVLRLRRRAAVPGKIPTNEIPLESGHIDLDAGAETRLHGHRG